MGEDKERYQTVLPGPTVRSRRRPPVCISRRKLLDEIRARGVKICFVTLHVGPGTFAPVKTETLAAHKMHEERFELGEETATP
jgi:S-adenosylmethionine:tRNA ribosyltransferase-isomerase